jgi:hypothetical protein
MIGVALGGGLTFLTQRVTQRAAERAEERRQRSALAEARRAEQIQTLTQFIRFTYEATGVAFARPPTWETGDDWYRTARPAMDGLRIAEDSIKLLCHPSLHAPATAYSRALNHVVWQEHGETTVAEYLEPFKAEFLAAARASLMTS